MDVFFLWLGMSPAEFTKLLVFKVIIVGTGRVVYGVVKASTFNYGSCDGLGNLLVIS